MSKLDVISDVLTVLIISFVFFLLVYVFILVFWQLSPIWGLMFVIVVGLMLIAIIIELLEERKCH
jgi:hypothetical protein